MLIETVTIHIRLRNTAADGVSEALVSVILSVLLASSVLLFDIIEMSDLFPAI